MSEFDDDVVEDYRNEQAYFNSLSTIPLAKDGLVPRFWKGYDCPDSTTCDVVYIDRVTGREVLRYDGADPANTRFDYGAPVDADVLKRRGFDLKEMVDPSVCVLTERECASRMRQDYTDYSDYWEDDCPEVDEPDDDFYLEDD